MHIAKAKRLVLNIPLTFNFPAFVFALNSFMVAFTFGLIFRRSFGILFMLLFRVFFR